MSTASGFTQRAIVSLPTWLSQAVVHGLMTREQGRPLDLAIALAEENAKHRTGGPFGAVVYAKATGTIVSVGVNRVVALRNPTLHAECVAIVMAAKRLRSFSLESALAPHLTLYSSSEPCLMCLGAAHWAGVTEIVYGAGVLHAERVGFDEGAAQRAVRHDLEMEGIRIIAGRRERRVKLLLDQYARRGGPIYNGRDTKAPRPR